MHGKDYPLRRVRKDVTKVGTQPVYGTAGFLEYTTEGLLYTAHTFYPFAIVKNNNSSTIQIGIDVILCDTGIRYRHVESCIFIATPSCQILGKGYNKQERQDPIDTNLNEDEQSKKQS